MRYVLYAFVAVAMTVSWMNNTSDGHRFKRQLTSPPHHATSPD